MASRLFSPLRCGTSSTRTVRGCCWFTTWASERVLMPSTVGWGRWSRKWALRPIWKASCSSSAPTRSDLGVYVGHGQVQVMVWDEAATRGRQIWQTLCQRLPTSGLKQPNGHMSSQVDLTKRRVVDEGEGRLWAESRGFHYFETSAQSGEGINEMFQVCFCAKHVNTNTHTHTLSTSLGSLVLLFIHHRHVWERREAPGDRGQRGLHQRAGRYHTPHPQQQRLLGHAGREAWCHTVSQGSEVRSQGPDVAIYIWCCRGLFSGRKWTKRTGSWPSCSTLTNVWPLAAKTPSRLWWTLAPHCWRTLNSTKPQVEARSHTGPRWTLSCLGFIYLFSVKILRATVLDANSPPRFLKLYLYACFGYSSTRLKCNIWWKLLILHKFKKLILDFKRINREILFMLFFSLFVTSFIYIILISHSYLKLKCLKSFSCDEL